MCHGSDKLLEYCTIVSLKDFIDILIMNYRVDSFPFEELTSHFKELLAQRFSTNLKNEPEIIFLIDSIMHLAQVLDAWMQRIHFVN